MLMLILMLILMVSSLDCSVGKVVGILEALRDNATSSCYCIVLPSIDVDVFSLPVATSRFSLTRLVYGTSKIFVPDWRLIHSFCVMDLMIRMFAIRKKTTLRDVAVLVELSVPCPSRLAGFFDTLLRVLVPM
jgi:hypothetical protein